MDSRKDGDRRWRHMTTNLAESINSILKKSRNLPIGALVKLTYLRCNALFNKGGREVEVMLACGQVYTQVLKKAIDDTQRKTNTHIVLEFNQCDTRFLV